MQRTFARATWSSSSAVPDKGKRGKILRRRRRRASSSRRSR